MIAARSGGSTGGQQTHRRPSPGGGLSEIQESPIHVSVRRSRGSACRDRALSHRERSQLSGISMSRSSNHQPSRCDRESRTDHRRSRSTDRRRMPGRLRRGARDRGIVEGPLVRARALSVTLQLATGDGLACDAMNIDDTAQPTSFGVATFDPRGALSTTRSEHPNEPTLTDYKLDPRVAQRGDHNRGFSHAGGSASDPFDIWEAGCKGDGCEAEPHAGTEAADATDHGRSCSTGARSRAQ